MMVTNFNGMCSKINLYLKSLYALIKNITTYLAVKEMASLSLYHNIKNS